MLLPLDIKPLARCRSLGDFEAFSTSQISQRCNRFDEEIVERNGALEAWTLPGYSLLAGQHVEFLVDQQSGGELVEGIWRPNLRERLVCPVTLLNNRQRLIAEITSNRSFQRADIYFMEQVTPVFAWAQNSLRLCKVIGSEYLGQDVEPGSSIDNLRHENIENLSFCSQSMDFIVSNEVFEHVANPRVAFSECSRVLRKGGRLIMTIPFFPWSNQSVTRAILTETGELEYLLEPIYHGNPVLPEEGSLVFTDFGWDLIDTLLSVGFRDSWVDIYHSEQYGHLGNGLYVIEAVN